MAYNAYIGSVGTVVQQPDANQQSAPSTYWQPPVSGMQYFMPNQTATVPQTTIAPVGLAQQVPVVQGQATPMVPANPVAVPIQATNFIPVPANPLPAELNGLNSSLGNQYPIGTMNDAQWAALSAEFQPGGHFNPTMLNAWSPVINASLNKTLSDNGFSPELAGQISSSAQLSNLMKLRMSVDLHNKRITPAQSLEIAYFYLRADQALPRNANGDSIKEFEQEQQQRNGLANQISQYALSLPVLDLTLPGGLNLTDFFKSPTLPDWSSQLGIALDPTGNSYTQNVASVPQNTSAKIAGHEQSSNSLAKKLAEEGRKVANGRTESSRHCYSMIDGVTKAMDNAGLGKYLQGDNAEDAAEGPPGSSGLGLKNDPRFIEVTGTSTLKEGDVIVYKGNPATGHKAGHIEIAQGNGKATSDFISDVNSGKAYAGTRIFRLKDSVTTA